MPRQKETPAIPTVHEALDVLTIEQLKPLVALLPGPNPTLVSPAANSSALCVAQLEQGELLSLHSATPACVRRRTSLRVDGCRGAPVSDVQRQLEVETRQHIQQEVPIRTDMSIDERRQRPEILHGQPGGPAGLAEHPLQHQGIDRDQGVLEQM